MKNAPYFLTLLSLVTCLFFASCAAKRKLPVTKPQVDQNTKDNVETSKNDKTTTETKSKPVIKKDTYIALPPENVKEKFKSSYPLATNVVWTKEMPSVVGSNKDIRDYKADFLIEENKNSVVYAEAGTIIETREGILPDQLPPNIYSAIILKYPNAIIVSASTLKNAKMDGSYIAIIQLKGTLEVKQVKLMENGTFVE